MAQYTETLNKKFFKNITFLDEISNDSKFSPHLRTDILNLLFFYDFLYVLVLPEFINIVSILYYTFIEFIILFYNFLVISFTQYKKYMI